MKNNSFLYSDLYDYYKQLIESGKLTAGDRLPSIRRCAELHRVSKTTVDKAYMLLCDDGYIIPKNQSGFYVSQKLTKRLAENELLIKKEKEKRSVSDYTSTGVDSEVFDLTLWTRYVKRSLRRREKLMDYGEPQGEEGLRDGIASYLKSNRSCVCDRDDLVIGAGVQNLLNILCPLLGSDRRKIYFNDTSYRQGMAVFKDHGYTVVNSPDEADILYFSPSHMSKAGSIMSVARRHELVSYARKNGKLIIEDDYDSEFRDISSPTPSLQGLDSEHVIYIGSFSKLLLPSIRISYMLLCPFLREKYLAVSGSYNQTVSIPDQLALEEFIADNKLISQVKRARKIYTQKSRLLRECLKREFGDSLRLGKNVTPLYVSCSFRFSGEARELEERLSRLSRPIKIIVVKKEEDRLFASFSVSFVEAENIEQDIHNLRLTVREINVEQQ
ncbi:MAG: PLP-dependent aminotransferase family protein [Clostridia bacterium]|nr:PLP-dependent aminotransferase family protein [Clostridia bacterium]